MVLPRDLQEETVGRLEPLGTGPGVALTSAGPIGFGPFDDCATQWCARDYVLTSDEDRFEIAVRLPEGVHLDHGAAELPLEVDGDVRTATVRGSGLVAPPVGTEVLDHTLRIGPEDAPTTSEGAVAAALTVMTRRWEPDEPGPIVGCRDD